MTSAPADASGGRTLIRRLAEWASDLELDDAPDRVVAHLGSQLLSQLAAARTGYAHPLGRRIARAYGGPLQPDPARAAVSLAMAAICLDHDDTAYAGHLSHSCVTVPVVYARQLRLDGRQLLTAILAADETAARVTAAATLGPFRGQAAAHTHLAGTVAGRLRALDAPARTWVNGLGLAFSVPPWPLTPGFLSTDAKGFAAAAPIQTGLTACDGARAGLRGPADVLEHPEGFLRRYADVPLPEEAVAGLGTLWHTETLSYKVHPGSAYIGAAVDCAVDCAAGLRAAGADPDDIAEVVVEGSLLTSGLDRASRARHIGPDADVAALNFSLPYNVATALLTGTLEPADLMPPAVERPERWKLAAKVRTVHDPHLSRAALLSTAPLGQALRRAGEHADTWVRAADARAADMLPPSWLAPETDFRFATKRLGARVTVRLHDGRELSAHRAQAVGAAGGGEHTALAGEKFLRSGGHPEVPHMVADMAGLDANGVAELISLALSGAVDEARAEISRGERRRPGRSRRTPSVDTRALEGAYGRLLGSADSVPDRELAELALEAAALAASGVLSEAEVETAAVDALLASAPRDVLVDLVRRNAAHLLGVLDRMPAGDEGHWARGVEELRDHVERAQSAGEQRGTSGEKSAERAHDG
ncbi:MmgE/PrpD family protein [Streptomyces tauricus]|uniref:MmgE/PrpD family protein n=1 Tax=Streptomyces tauricus TaxID=68274 RepID=A0ABZ1JDU8_9ACTN|nr:MmgE/PrpD family protein [Streptomyces tauricus]